LIDSRKVIKTEPGFWVMPSEQFMGKIENLLGKGAVHFT